ncbi:MAG TPA: RNA-binding domain-containing protein [Galbitalea sp.]|jgi:hypothetical protein|nr:RNA-binding domain-containing protein [Galbitalea sp.]
MALNIDSSKPLRNYSSLKVLVEGIRDCGDPGAEHHAIEWKRSLDLKDREAQWAVARAILAMSNRTVAGAARHFGGVGYVVVGADVGAVAGTDKWDGQQLEPLLSRYLGKDGPTWHHDNIDVDGRSVLVITVEAPSKGDRIHTVRKEISDQKGKVLAVEGEIFIRRGSTSVRANPADIRELEDRLLSGVHAPDMDVQLTLDSTNDPIVVLLDLTDTAIERKVVSKRAELIAPLEEFERTKSTRFGLATGLGLTELRTPAEFRHEVDKYLKAYGVSVPNLARNRAFELFESHSVHLRLQNLGLEALEEVQLRLRFPSPFEPLFDQVDPKTPDEPQPWGSSFTAFYRAPRMPFLGGIHRPNDPETEFHNESRSATFPMGTLHAGASIAAEPFVLLVVGLPESECVFHASVVARNRRGIAEFEFSVPLGNRTVTPLQLLGGSAG